MEGEAWPKVESHGVTSEAQVSGPADLFNNEEHRHRRAVAVTVEHGTRRAEGIAVEFEAVGDDVEDAGAAGVDGPVVDIVASEIVVGQQVCDHGANMTCQQVGTRRDTGPS